MCVLIVLTHFRVEVRSEGNVRMLKVCTKHNNKCTFVLFYFMFESVAMCNQGESNPFLDSASQVFKRFYVCKINFLNKLCFFKRNKTFFAFSINHILLHKSC